MHTRSRLNACSGSKPFTSSFVIFWFAGIFYLPRLFVYHSMATDRISIERFKIMERKLYRGIMTPSAMIAVALGIWLLAGIVGCVRTRGLDARQD